MRLAPGSLARVLDRYDRDPSRVALGALSELFKDDGDPTMRQHVVVPGGTPALVVSDAVQVGSGLRAFVVVAASTTVPTWVYDDELRGVGRACARDRVQA